MQWHSYLFSFANIPLLFNAAFSFPVDNHNVQWQHSSNIPKYTNTQAWDLFSFRNSPTECRCYFSSHPVKSACALYCAPQRSCYNRWFPKCLLVNMLTNRYHICTLMDMTMDDPLGFCLSCYRDLPSHRATSHVSPFKKIPLSMLLPRLSVEICPHIWHTTTVSL